MKADILNALIEAVKNVYGATGLGEFKMLGKPEFVSQPVSSESVCVLIGTTGDLQSQIVFSYTKITALEIANSLMMGLGSGELDEMSKSAIQELSNMTLGTFATLITNLNYKIDITIPTLLIGEGMQISSSTRGIKLRLGNDNGVGIVVTVMLKE